MRVINQTKVHRVRGSFIDKVPTNYIGYINTREQIRYLFTCVVTAFLRAGNPCITPQFINYNMQTFYAFAVFLAVVDYKQFQSFFSAKSVAYEEKKNTEKKVGEKN